MIYKPREDSEMLLKQAKKHAKANVLEIGCGSGFISFSIAPLVKSITATDINPEAIEYCKKHNTFKNLTFLQSDLFKNIKNKFNTIIFNPPYLPEDKIEDKASSLATTGGKHGYEIIEKFLNQAKNHLEKHGIILLLFSSLTNKEKINEILKKNNYQFKQLDKHKMFFEELYVYLVKFK